MRLSILARSTLISENAPVEKNEQGFSLIEALVVLAISSMLLLILTSTISLARSQNIRLAEHSRIAGDQFYADLQLQAMLDRIYVDPLLQSYGAQPSLTNRRAALHTEESWAQLDSDVAFRGTSESFEFSTRLETSDDVSTPRVTIAWVDRADGRQLSMTIDGETIVWPVLYDVQTRFKFLTLDGDLVETFPPALNASRSLSRTRPRVTDRNPILLPKSILAYREDLGAPVFIVDVP